MKKIIVTLFSVMMIFLSACGSTAEVSEAATTTEKSSSVKEIKSDKNLYKGAGLVIAVTAPEVRNGGKAESWMPQFFQDSITGNLAKYSKMTVLDRANEDLTKAEQELGETGFYTEENAVQLGQMTNAQYAVFGSITALSSSYELNFRAIDITTNEVKAAYNDRAGSKEIEDGTTVRAIITELLDGLGIGLSEKEKAQLAKTDKKSLNATKSLAKGAAAEKADNLIEALAFYAEAQENGATKKEASAGINNILGTNGTVSGNAIANLKAQAEYEKQQEAKWEKILNELNAYVKENAFILVYDFSNINLSLYDSEYAHLKATGVKIIPVRSVLLLTNKILTEWVKVKNVKENERWVKKITGNWGYAFPVFFYPNYNYLENISYKLIAGIYDKSDYRVAEGQCIYPSACAEIDNIKTQKKYFEDAMYAEFFASIKITDLPDNSDLIIKPLKLERYSGQWHGEYKISFMSIDEYNDWEKEQ